MALVRYDLQKTEGTYRLVCDGQYWPECSYENLTAATRVFGLNNTQINELARNEVINLPISQALRGIQGT